MKSKAIHIIWISTMVLSVHYGFSQETVFNGLQSNYKKAQKSLARGSYVEALKYFQAAKHQKNPPAEIDLKIAETYAHLKDHKNAVICFKRYYQQHGDLPLGMDYLLAESLSGLGDYQEAISWYRHYGQRNPSDKRIMQKIWRLNNIIYLFEDSIYYSVKPLQLNTEAIEYAPVMLDGSLIFVSNREVYGGIKVLDGVHQKPFFKRYAVSIESGEHKEKHYGSPRPFATELEGKFHQGPITFSENGAMAVFTKSSARTDQQGNYRLQLYYTFRTGAKWSEPVAVEFCDPLYSYGNPSLSEDGKQLYFSSDCPDGMGGKDLYRSQRTAYGWSTPQNLGNLVNTAGDEDFPFVHGNGYLYFASDGHGGLGGLDVFKVKVLAHGFGEIQNMGYPLNTHYDDFSIYLNPDGSSGYMVSNRAEGALNDDIFELQIDLQTYPLTIKGTLKFRNAQWKDELKIDPFSHGQMQLIDVYNGKMVYQTISGSGGEFTLEIPYSSQFKIKVTHAELGEHAASLEIPKNKKLYHHYEIIIVKEEFQLTNPEQGPETLNVKSEGHEEE